MRNFRLLVLLALCLPGLVACDQAINRAAAEYLKYSLREVCGEDDPACIEAVNTQFDPCHEKYSEEWAAYMKSSLAEEDALLEYYSRKMYACILDENGEPWFVYDP